MLAKSWKKILLAVCIIACIFNIMSKLVNRHSLKENLETANDGITVFDMFQKKKIEVTQTEEVIDNVMSGNYSEQITEPENDESINTEITNTEKNENVVIVNTEQVQESKENVEQQENEKTNNSETFTYKDYLTNLFNF